jgi:hypothetical protein
VLRERRDADGGGRPDPELTFKYRSPDLFLAARTRVDRPRGGEGGKLVALDDKLEEDLTLVEGHEPGSLSTRSQFSRSAELALAVERLATLGDLAERYDVLREDLSHARRTRMLGAPLRAGPEIRERTFKSGKFELGGGVKARFTLTLWSRDDARRPAVAEVSFKYKPEDAADALRSVAGNARALFLELARAGRWVDQRGGTKTAYGLRGEG